MFHRFDDQLCVRFRASKPENKEELENMIPYRNAVAEAINKHKDAFIKIILENGLKNNGSQLSQKSKDILFPMITDIEEKLKKKTGAVYAGVMVDLSYTNYIYMRVSCDVFELSKCILRKNTELVCKGQMRPIWRFTGLEQLSEEDNTTLDYYYFDDALRAFTELEKKREQLKTLHDEIRGLERGIIDLLKD